MLTKCKFIIRSKILTKRDKQELRRFEVKERRVSSVIC